MTLPSTKAAHRGCRSRGSGDRDSLLVGEAGKPRPREAGLPRRGAGQGAEPGVESGTRRTPGLPRAVLARPAPTDLHHPATEPEVERACRSILTGSRPQGGPDTGEQDRETADVVGLLCPQQTVPRTTGRSRGLRGSLKSGAPGGSADPVSLPSKAAEPTANRDPALCMEHCSATRAAGTASRTRPFPGSYLKQVIKVGSIPPSLGSGSGVVPKALPTPLAEVQGDFSL